MSNFDISASVLPHLTPHLIAPLLKTLQQNNVYPADFLIKQRFVVLSKTRNYPELLSLAAEAPAVINADKKAQIEQAKAAYDAEFIAAGEALSTEWVSFITEVSTMATRDLQNLTRDIIQGRVTSTTTTLAALQAYAVLAFEGGQYLISTVAYFVYLLLAEDIISGPFQITKTILWSMTESALLCKQHQIPILETFMKKLRDAIDNGSSNLTLTVQSQQRATFLAFSLYALTSEMPSNALLAQRTMWSDMIFSQQLASTPGSFPTSSGPTAAQNERLLNSLLFETPALLRYVVLATLIAVRVPSSQITPWLLKKSKFVSELTRVVQIQFPNQESIEQKDPFIRFFQQVLIEFDLAAALDTLHNDIPKVFQQDPFLSSGALQLDFYEAAKAILIDTALRLNTNVTLAGLQAILPLKIQCEGFSNTIQLISTPPASKEEKKDDKKDEKKDGPEVATTEAVVETEEVPLVAVVQPTNDTKLSSPLLDRGDFHSRLLKKVKPSKK